MTDNREPIGTFADGYELHIDEEPWPRDVDPEPYGTVDDRSPAVIVWMLGAIVAAVIVVVAWVVWHD